MKDTLRGLMLEMLTRRAVQIDQALFRSFSTSIAGDVVKAKIAVQMIKDIAGEAFLPGGFSHIDNLLGRTVLNNFGHYATRALTDASTRTELLKLVFGHFSQVEDVEYQKWLKMSASPFLDEILFLSQLFNPTVKASEDLLSQSEEKLILYISSNAASLTIAAKFTYLILGLHGSLDNVFVSHYSHREYRYDLPEDGAICFLYGRLGTLVRTRDIMQLLGYTATRSIELSAIELSDKKYVTCSRGDLRFLSEWSIGRRTVAQLRAKYAAAPTGDIVQDYDDFMDYAVLKPAISEWWNYDISAFTASEAPYSGKTAGVRLKSNLAAVSFRSTFVTYATRAEGWTGKLIEPFMCDLGAALIGHSKIDYDPLTGHQISTRNVETILDERKGVVASLFTPFDMMDAYLDERRYPSTEQFRVFNGFLI